MMNSNINPIAQAMLAALALSPAVLAAETPAIQSDSDTIIVIGQQNSYLNPTVSTATKLEADPQDIPQTINVINAQFLDDIRAERLEDAYGYTTGLIRTGTDAEDFTLRGLPASLSSVQVNGLPGLASRFGSPTTANVERIEILKGPASVMYGQIEPGGLINIVTKKPQEATSIRYDISGQTYATGVSHFGENNGQTATIDATGSANADKTWLYRMIVSAENTDSYRDDVDHQNYYLFPSLTYRASDVSEVTFGLELQKETRVADNGLAALNHDINQVASINTHYQSADDTDKDTGTIAYASFNTMLTNDFDLNVDWRSTWHKDERHLYENRSVDNSTGTLSVRDRDQVNKREYHTIDVRTTGSIWTGNIEHRMLLGTNVGYEERDFLRETYGTLNLDVLNPDSPSGRNEAKYKVNHRITQYNNYSFYAQDTMYLSESWVLMGGTRYSWQNVDFDFVSDNTKDSQTTDAWTSQAGLVYKLDDSTSIYTSFAQSFNPNSVEDKDVNGKAFDPEKGQQIEIGTKTALLNNKANVTLAYFAIQKSNIVEENAQGDNELLGEIHSSGVEFEMQVMPIDNWQIKTGYAYVDSRIADSPDPAVEDQRTAMTAYHDAYIWTKYNFPYQVLNGVVGITLGANYEGKRYTDSNPDSRVTLPESVVVDTGLHYETKAYQVSLNVGNLFDERYYSGGSGDSRLYAGDPRKVTLSLSGTF